MTLDYAPTPDGQPLIWVWLNGNTPARFVLDTGTNVCLISNALATKIGLTPQPSLAKIDGKQAQQVTVPMLQVGTIRYPNIQMVVINGGTLPAVSSQVDGVLGVTALTTDPVFIDFQKRQATLFYDTPITDKQLQSLGMGGASSVPLTDPNSDLKFQAVMQLASGSKKASVRLTVDTGGTHTIIPETAARSLGLEMRSTQNLNQLFSDMAVSDAYLSSVSFGLPGTEVEGLEAKCVRGVVPSSFALSLGLDVLSHFQVLIDFGAKKMYLKPVSAPSVPMSIPKIMVGGK